MKRAALILTALILMASAPPPPAPVEDRPLADPAQEARAQAIHESLRCVVFQNESIAESGAVLAADLRQVVRSARRTASVYRAPAPGRARARPRGRHRRGAPRLHGRAIWCLRPAQTAI
mgnify:CR=1 FL=1